MNTNSLTNQKDTKDEFDSLFSFESEKDELKHNEFVLMSGYLSEIEKLKKPLKFNRKELAKKIGTSASYLTQVFRGDKPLNFITIAKIQKVLNIKFEVKTKVLNDACYFEIATNNDIIRAVSAHNEYTTSMGITISGYGQYTPEKAFPLIYG